MAADSDLQRARLVREEEIPDPGDRHVTEFEMAGQGAGTLVVGIDWLGLQGGIDNLADRLLI